MFEKQFRSIAKFAIKNRKKIIIAWIILFLVLSPFAIDFISNTNFNFANGLVTKQSESFNANLTFSEQFGSRAQQDPTMVIVTTGTNINNAHDAAQLIELQNNLTSYFSSHNLGFRKLQSIFTVEKSILSSVTGNATLQLNGTKQLIVSANNAVYTLIPQANGTVSFFYGLVMVYFQHFVKDIGSHDVSYSLNDSYNFTRQYIAFYVTPNGLFTPQLAYSYMDNLTGVWNGTVNLANPSADNLSLMNSALNTTVLEPTPFSRDLYNLSHEVAGLTAMIVSNITLYQFSNPSLYKYALDEFSVGIISSNSTIDSAVARLGLVVSPYTLVYDAFNLSSSPQNNIFLNYTASNFVLYSLEAIFAGQPTIRANSGIALGYLDYLQNTTLPVSQIVQVELQKGFSAYPFVPKWYVLHQLVGYDNSTTIIEATFSKNFGIDLVNSVTSLAEGFSTQSGLPGSSFYVAGSSASASEYEQQSMSGLVTALVIGILLSVLIVGIFFRSPVAALIPLSIFMLSAIISMGLGYLVYDEFFHSQVSFITPTLLLILLLGITSDYVVYIMSRYRRELRVNSPEPIEDAGQWAGHAVFTSGITVAASYMILWLANVPLFSDAGITNAIGVTVTIILANTFLIALLQILKDRIFWPSKPGEMTHASFERPMSRIAGVVTTHKYQFMAIFVVISLLGIYVYAVTPTGLDIFALLPNNSSTQAVQAVNSSFNGDFFERNYMILEMPSPIYQNVSGNITYNNTEMTHITQVEDLLLNQSQISQVYGPSYPYGYYQNWSLSNITGSDINHYTNPYTSMILSYFGNNSRYAIIYYQTSALAYSPYITNAMNGIDQKVAALGSADGFQYYNGGLSQGLTDANSYSHSAYNEIVPLIVITVAIILLIQLSSLLTPVRLLIMVLAMVVFSLALTYIYFFYILSLPVIIFLPMFVFVTLLAVGLDYDIFMITRVREEVIKGSSTDEAIRKSVSENGGVIVVLGSILFVTFFALNFANFSILSEIGTGLALGILLDTFVSWPFFVPAIMTIMEKYNWWPSSISKRD